MTIKPRLKPADPRDAHQQVLDQIKEYLNSPEPISIMSIASDEGKPAVMALAWDLEARFGDIVKRPEVKQQIGKTALIILGKLGYVPDQRGVAIPGDDNFFSYATRYKKTR